MERSSENNPVAGHCAIATEALYDLLGGAAAGFTPYVCSYYDIGDKRIFGVADDKKQQKTHWWLRAPMACALAGAINRAIAPKAIEVLIFMVISLFFLLHILTRKM